MHILIVGAGATGTAFGAALLRAGARVSYYVREPHRTRIEAGLLVHHQGFFSVEDERLPGLEVVTSPAEARRGQWDEVWITTPSDALRGPWLDEFLPATGDATLVVFQPDPEDIEYIRAHGGRERRIVQGLIQFSAWQSPLPHEPASRTGITVLAPPGPAALFDAELAEAETIAATLTRGGLRAGVRQDMAAHAARMSALMIPLIAGLELAGWRFSRYASHESLGIAVEAVHEAVAAEAARFSAKEPAVLRLGVNRGSVWLLLRMMPWVPGFNAEAFLAYHFRKVDRQTRQMLATYRAHAEAHGLPHAALDRLIGALPPPTH